MEDRKGSDVEPVDGIESSSSEGIFELLDSFIPADTVSVESISMILLVDLNLRCKIYMLKLLTVNWSIT